VGEGYGFHPLTVFSDHGAEGKGEPVPIVLRPGNAGSNTAADHITAVKLALADAIGKGPRPCRRMACASRHAGPGHPRSPQPCTGLTPSRPADQRNAAPASRNENPGACGTRPPGATAGLAATPQR